MLAGEDNEEEQKYAMHSAPEPQEYDGMEFALDSGAHPSLINQPTPGMRPLTHKVCTNLVHTLVRGWLRSQC